MRMFQVCTCGEPLQLNEAPTPKPQGSEVLLRMIAAGVCHSDLHLSDGYFDLGGGKKLSVVERGMKLPDNVIDYCLRYLRRDFPNLMATLDALDEWSLTEKKPVTVPLLRKLLQLPLNI